MYSTPINLSREEEGKGGKELLELRSRQAAWEQSVWVDDDITVSIHLWLIQHVIWLWNLWHCTLSKKNVPYKKWTNSWFSLNQIISCTEIPLLAPRDKALLGRLSWQRAKMVSHFSTFPLLPPLSHIETSEHNRGVSDSKVQIRHLHNNLGEILAWQTTKPLFLGWPIQLSSIHRRFEWK